MTRKKQFIAGAVCPECSDTDSLVLYSDNQSIACVSCDFTKTSQERDITSAEETAVKTQINNDHLINIINLSD